MGLKVQPAQMPEPNPDSDTEDVGEPKMKQVKFSDEIATDSESEEEFSPKANLNNLRQRGKSERIRKQFGKPRYEYKAKMAPTQNYSLVAPSLYQRMVANR